MMCISSLHGASVTQASQAIPMIITIPYCNILYFTVYFWIVRGYLKKTL